MRRTGSRPKLGQTTLTALVVANMVGAGVFTTSGFALADLGTANRVMLAWLCGGVIAICGALCYGGLASRLTESGGEYLYLSRVLHPMAGFIGGWISLLAGFTGAIAFAAHTFESYVLPNPPPWLPANALAVALVAVTAIAHGFRLKPGALSQNTAVVFKLVLILAFLIYAGSLGNAPAAAEPVIAEPFSLVAFAGSLVWISLSYSGFNAAIYVAGEAENPARNVPKALWRGTCLVTLLYLAMNAVFVYLPPFEAVVGREDIAAAAAQVIGGEALGVAVRALIAIALVTSVSSMVMAGPRVYARMADDRLFPQQFRFQGEVPRRSIALQALLGIVVILVTDLEKLLGYLGFTLSLSAALTAATLFRLRRREGAAAVPVIGYPFTPIIFIGATLSLAVLAAKDKPGEIIAAVITVVVGLGFYFLTTKLRKNSEEPQTADSLNS